VILHVVLFTPRSDLRTADYDQFAAALDRALTTIPSVVSHRIGRRLATGAAYDAGPRRFEYCAVIEFENRDGLAAYLSHPAHDELGRLFYTMSADAFAGDFDAVDTPPAAALRAWTGAR
jgi:hypothetical protein